MKTNCMFIDCRNSGISGDLFVAALYELVKDESVFEDAMSVIQSEFPDINISTALIEKVKRNSVVVNRLKLAYHDDSHESDHHHSHSIAALKTKISEICKKFGVSPLGHKFASKVMDIIADAEGSVHKTPIEQVHLHEIGSIDTVIDICVSTYFLEKLGIFKTDNASNIEVLCSPIVVGGGTVKISHGVVPVPAPATDQIIKKYNLPVLGGPIEKELCTPTGAALIASLMVNVGLKYESFLPEMSVENLGMSTGNLKTEEFPNILRIYFGHRRDVCSPNFKPNQGALLDLGAKMQDVIVLETTVDDMTGEDLGSLMDLLFDQNALDVNFISVQTKKNRPGTLIRVLCDKDNEETCITAILKNTSTLGVRIRSEQRVCLSRKIIENSIEIEGKVFQYRVKIAGPLTSDRDFVQYKIDHDDIKNVALNTTLSIIEARNSLTADFFNNLG